jgi:iduronate 2-sulfatase
MTFFLVSCNSILPKKSTPGTRPNVLFIIVDDLKPLTGCYGDTLAVTPNIDRLAERGLMFENAHCAQAICGPSRASLLTGMRPDNTRTWFMDRDSDYKFFRLLNQGIITLPQLFKENGYTSIGIGKVFDVRNLTPEEDSISWSRKPAYFDAEGVAYALRTHLPDSGFFNPMYNRIRPSTECADVEDEVYYDGMICKRAVGFLEEFARTGEPFFLAVGFRRPHLPFTATEKYWNLYRRENFSPASFQEHATNSPDFAYHNYFELRSYQDIPDTGNIDRSKQLELIHAYYACASFIDDKVGRLLDELERTDLINNTVIVLVGDHGWHLGDHGLWCKLTNYEQSTRTPLIISVPGMDNPGESSDAPVDLVDIYMTLSDLAGINIPQRKDGKSLVPILSDPGGSVRSVAISQFPRGNVMGYAYRSKRYRYVVWVEKDTRNGGPNGQIVARELYDYVLDPEEKINFIDFPAYEEVTERFSKIADGTYGVDSIITELDIEPVKRNP